MANELMDKVRAVEDRVAELEIDLDARITKFENLFNEALETVAKAVDTLEARIAALEKWRKS